MPKPKKTQPKTPDQIQGRDLFQTPNYAVDLLVPFLPRPNGDVIWGPACGEGKITRRLAHHGYPVIGTDLRSKHPVNFLTDERPSSFGLIIENPPFSLKQEFAAKCLDHGKPWALLVPADPAAWNLDLISKHGCQLLMPTRRIDYITPDILDNVYAGEVLIAIKSGTGIDWKAKIKQATGRGWKKDDWDKIPPDVRGRYSAGIVRYERIDDVPPALLARYSASQFHSCWLTWGLNLPDRMTIVSLTKQDKLNV